MAAIFPSWSPIQCRSGRRKAITFEVAVQDGEADASTSSQSGRDECDAERCGCNMRFGVVGVGRGGAADEQSPDRIARSIPDGCARAEEARGEIVRGIRRGIRPGRRIGQLCAHRRFDQRRRGKPRPIDASRRSIKGATAGSGAGYQWPVLGIESHGSAGASASPFCSSSIDCLSGERTNAIWPSRGGRLMVMPSFISRAQVA